MSSKLGVDDQYRPDRVGISCDTVGSLVTLRGFPSSTNDDRRDEEVENEESRVDIGAILT